MRDYGTIYESRGGEEPGLRKLGTHWVPGGAGVHPRKSADLSGGADTDRRYDFVPYLPILGRNRPGHVHGRQPVLQHAHGPAEAVSRRRTESGAAAPSGAPNAIEYNGGGALVGAVNIEAKRKFLSQSSDGAPFSKRCEPRTCRHGYGPCTSRFRRRNAALGWGLLTSTCPRRTHQRRYTRRAQHPERCYASRRRLRERSNAPDSIDLELAGRSDHRRTRSTSRCSTRVWAPREESTIHVRRRWLSFVAGACARQTRTTIPALNASGCSANDEYYFRVIVGWVRPDLARARGVRTF
jgi:hypothetical protein